MANFNLNKTIVDVEISGEKYIATVDIKTIVHFKKENKFSFLQATQSLADMDDVTILQLLASVLRKSEKSEPVGMNELRKYNPLALIDELTPVLVEVMGFNMPEAEDEAEKK